ncbi:hypothetical protein TWF718_004277 [Orbilia javanica]|uniref:EDC4-like protein pdc1 beta-propeller domain-containing protein n=1 Tax=Orbilia javanica TaxID=47235 RepID=A0AAN8N606_9PEZI
MAGPGPSFDSLFDKLRSNGPAGVNGASSPLHHPSRPSSNPQFHHQPSYSSLPPSQRSSYGAMPPQGFGIEYGHARNTSNDSLLQTLESAISAHPTAHRFHQQHHLPPSFSPQPHFGSIDSQAVMQVPMHYGSHAPTQLNRQLGAEHGRHSSADDPMVPQNYLMGLLHKQTSGNVGQQASHQGRRSVDNIPQMPQRFEAVREGARSTSFADGPTTAPPQQQQQMPTRQSLPAHDQPLNDLVSSLLSNAPKQQPPVENNNNNVAAAASATGVHDPRSIMSPAPREVANPAAADLLHQILGRSKPVQDDAGSVASASSQQNKQSPESPIGGPSSVGATIPDTAPAGLDQPPVKQPLFTYVNPFEHLSRTNPRNRSPKMQQASLTNGHSSPSLVNPVGLSTPSNIPLPFSPPPPHAIEDVAVLQVEPKASFTDIAANNNNVERHTPPLTQPYVEDVADPFEQEADVFDGETDPFEGDNATPPEDIGATDSQNGGFVDDDAQLDAIPDGIEDQVDLEEEEAVVATAEALTVAPTAQATVVEPSTAAAAALPSDTTPPPLPESTTSGAVQPSENGGAEKAAFTIFKFPMKPFSQITFNALPTVTVPGGRFSDIAKMTRNVDQMDRNLISASPSYIVYATGKSKGGVRIIRQEDGQDVVLMKDSTERTVNVALGKENQVLAVGVNGTVLWSELDGFDGPMDEAVMESRSFLFPPSALQDQNGGLTKSRTHLTQSHPKVFAIGRGRFISLIHADAARQYPVEEAGGITKINDSAYHANHSRTIDTQKVSKEFCFSEDDSTVVTIDKAGKIKFWDVSKLVEFERGEDELEYPTETARILTEPVLTRSAVGPGEMYKATSVIFVDKQQPYERRQALRYLIVGLQQNHVIQLWDIAIGRAVQELRFPTSSSGSDGLCSLSYHPKSGVIVVGNPNRNTISFIHLSTPKYNLQPFSQASFIKAVSEQSPNLPKLDATAIMSSIVEYSLGDRGQLISLEVLDSASSPQLPGDDAKPPIFELYISHTKGLTCLSLSKEDIGFDSNLRVMKGIDALATGACTLSALLPPTITSPTEPSKAEEPKSAIAPIVAEPPKAQVSNPPQQKAKAVEPQDEPVVEKPEEKPPVTNGQGQGRKAASMSGLGRGKKPRRDVNTVSFAGPALENDEPSPAPQPKKNKGKDREEKKVALSTVSISPELLEREVKKIEEAVNTSFTQALSKEIGSLYRKFDDDRRVQQAASDAKQEAVLRVVSNTLTTGLETTVEKILVSHLGRLAIDIKSALVENIPAALSDTIIRHMEATIPKTIEKTLASKAVLGSVAENIIAPLRQDADQAARENLQHSLQAFEVIGDNISKVFSNQLNKQSTQALKEARRVHEEDQQKIAQLTSTVAEMAKTISTLEATTARMIEMQQQLLANQEKLAAAAAAAASVTSGPINPSIPPTPMTAKSEVELLGDEIENLIRRGDFENGMLTWLQSKELQDFYFENYIVKYNPYDIVPKVSQVVALTIAASVTGNLETFTDERLGWLEACLNDFHTIREDNTQTMLPRITAVLVSRLQQFYMALSEESPGAPILKRVAGLSRVTARLMQSVHM